MARLHPSESSTSFGLLQKPPGRPQHTPDRTSDTETTPRRSARLAPRAKSPLSASPSPTLSREESTTLSPDPIPASPATPTAAHFKRRRVGGTHSAWPAAPNPPSSARDPAAASPTAAPKRKKTKAPSSSSLAFQQTHTRKRRAFAPSPDATTSTPSTTISTRFKRMRVRDVSPPPTSTPLKTTRKSMELLALSPKRQQPGMDDATPSKQIRRAGVADHDAASTPSKAEAGKKTARRSTPVKASALVKLPVVVEEEMQRKKDEPGEDEEMDHGVQYGPEIPAGLREKIPPPFKSRSIFWPDPRYTFFS